MFKRNPAVSAPMLPESHDFGDSLPPAGARRDSMGGGSQYKGRSTIQKLSDGVRKMSTSTATTQRKAQVTVEVDLHHISLISMKAQIPFANKRGWLWKCKSKGDRWLRRYFIIQGQMAVYFERENDSKPKGAFLLHSFVNVEYCNEVVKGRAFNFDLETPERTYYLSADSAEEAYEWGHAFANASGEAHCALYATKDSTESENIDKLEQMQSEYSRVLCERADDIADAVEKQKEESTRQITALKVETASMKEDVVRAREQLYQWQHLGENLLNLVQQQDMFFSAEQKEKIERMAENHKNLSELLKLFAN